ncbi:hypothetical protein SAFG77S_08453 [Streptomyces afghaniensis]
MTTFGSRVGRLRPLSVRRRGFRSPSAAVSAATRCGGVCPPNWACRSAPYGSQGASAAGAGSVRASVKAVISLTAVRAPKLAYQAGRSGSATWCRVHHWSSGSGSGAGGLLVGAGEQDAWHQGVVAVAPSAGTVEGNGDPGGLPPPARWSGVMKSTSRVSGVGALVTSVPRFVARVRGQAWEPGMRGPCGLRC